MLTRKLLKLDHAEFMHQVPDDYLADVMPIAKKIAAAGGFAQYNVLQVSQKKKSRSRDHFIYAKIFY